MCMFPDPEEDTLLTGKFYEIPVAPLEKGEKPTLNMFLIDSGMY